VEGLSMRRRFGTLAVHLFGAALSAALAAGFLVPPAARGDTVTTVSVERERPVREKLPTLRFLRANRDFIRSRFDRLRAEPRVTAAPAAPIEPRFLAYRQMLADVAAGRDSVTRAFDTRERAGMFTNVRDLDELERDLDQIERQLDLQRARLEVLQADFAGRQRTELDVVVTGAPLAGRVDSIAVTLEDGSRTVAALDSTQRESMKHGGALEVFRGLAEPREQTLEVALVGQGWTAAGHGFITLDPERDWLTFLKLDLSQAAPARGIGSLTAGTWKLETESTAADADRTHP